MKRWMTAVLIGGLMAGMAVRGEAAPASPKIAYVNVAKLFDQYQRTKESDKTLEAKASDREAAHQKLVAELKKLREGVEMLSDKAKEGRQQEIEAKVKALQEFERTAGEGLRRERDTIAREIFKDMEAVIKEVAGQQGFDLVINDQAILYGSAGLDITDVVLKTLNDRYTSKR